MLQELYSTNIRSSLIGLGIGAILVFFLQDVVRNEHLFAWLALLLTSTVLRAGLSHRYLRLAPAGVENTQRWLNYFRLLAIVSSGIWGASAFFLYADDQPHQFLLIFMLAGITAGATISFAADLFCNIVHTIFSLTPFLFRVLVGGDSVSLAMAMGISFYLAFLILTARQLHKQLLHNVQLGKAAAASEEHYRLVLNHAPIGIFHYDLNFKITYCNELLASILRVPAERVLGADLNQIRDTRILPALRNPLIGLIGHYEGQYSATISEAQAWVDLTAAPYQDAEGFLVGGVAIVQDISERKRIESDLRIAAITFESQQGMLITDEKGIILRVNRAFTHITGYEADEAVGKNPRFLQSGRHDAAFFTEMHLRLQTEGAWEGEIWNRRKSGEIYPEYLSITALKDVESNTINYVGSFTDISMRKAAENEIRNLAYYDPLTKLPNRRYLQDQLQHALATAARSKQNAALLFIDLDNFKSLNDTLGHDVGDELLQQVAIRLKSCVREGDTVARLGGDEFVVMLENLSTTALEAAAQTEATGHKILDKLSQTYKLSAYTYHNTPSIGATLFNGQKQSMDDLMKQADIAMYQAKKSGRNTLRFFDPKMQELINARVRLESELHTALKANQFLLYFQIQVDADRRIVGAEALIRWQHPTRGQLLPGEFIPLAEESSLILAIGSWVLNAACAQLSHWQHAPHTRNLTLAVNVSAKQFRQADFLPQLKQALQIHQVDPSKLKLELTESIMLDHSETALKTLHALQLLGVHLALDDFGTGYSSLQYLQVLPIQQLKIDRSFVIELAEKKGEHAIVSTIISMARSLDIAVIAEGVETEEQKALLEREGCQLFQGYLFAPPMPLAQMEEMLKAHSAVR